MKRCVFLSAFVAMFMAVLALPAADEPVVVKVWPGKAPGEKGDVGEEKFEEQKPNQKKVKRLTNVSVPTLTVYRPAKDKDTGAAVVIAPGGGYHVLAWDLEGEEVAQWLNTLGVTGIVLKYRVPRRPGDAKDQPPPQPLQDAQRALSLTRSKAKEWSIDPKRVGILGFSAGGHLAAAASTHYDKRTYETMDDVDKIDCRPDFAVLIYPGYLGTKDKGELASDIRVTKETPPMFLAVAGDDKGAAEGSLVMTQALRRAGVPTELHLYETGGHGFGLRPSEQPCAAWPKHCGDWMKARGLLQAKGDK